MELPHVEALAFSADGQKYFLYDDLLSLRPGGWQGGVVDRGRSQHCFDLNLSHFYERVPICIFARADDDADDAKKKDKKKRQKSDDNNGARQNSAAATSGGRKRKSAAASPRTCTTTWVKSSPASTWICNAPCAPRPLDRTRSSRGPPGP